MSQTHEKWMPLYVSDYLGDTQHLTTIEHGAYLLLLFNAWGRDGLLPNDPERLRRVVGMAPRDWKASWPTLREFFTETPDGFRHKRIDVELSRARENVDKRREAGKAGAAKRWHGDGNADAMANASQTDRPLPPPSPLPLPQGEEVHSENTSLHPRLAFSGRVIRLNQRDFDEWKRRYFSIPDLSAELGALDDWLRDQDETVRKKWFQVVSGALSKKHQAVIAESKTVEAGHAAIPI